MNMISITLTMVRCESDVFVLVTDGSTQMEKGDVFKVRDSWWNTQRIGIFDIAV